MLHPLDWQNTVGNKAMGVIGFFASLKLNPCEERRNLRIYNVKKMKIWVLSDLLWSGVPVMHPDMGWEWKSSHPQNKSLCLEPVVLFLLYWFVNGSIEVTTINGDILVHMALQYVFKVKKNEKQANTVSCQLRAVYMYLSALVWTFQENSKILININVGQMLTLKRQIFRIKICKLETMNPMCTTLSRTQAHKAILRVVTSISSHNDHTICMDDVTP